MEKNYYEDFFIALQNAVDKAGGISNFSRLSHIPQPSISRWLSRTRSPMLEAIAPVIPYIDWLKESAVIQRIGENTPKENVIGDNLKSVPVIMEVGAGNAVELWNKEPIMEIPVLEQYYHSNLRAVRVAGDSMEPTIKQGAIVGVIPIQDDLVEGHIYLINRPPFGYVVKRVRSSPSGNLVLYSDNPAYPPLEQPFEGYENVIIGQVIWCWQKI